MVIGITISPTRLNLLGLFTLILFLATFTDAYSQEPPDAGKALQEKEERPRPTKPPPQINVNPPVKSDKREEPALKVKVTALHITGNTLYSEKQLLALIDFNAGKEHTFAELQQAAAIITAYYRSNGHILAYAYLPAQEIKDVVVIDVLEGRVGQVIMELDPGLRLSETVAKGFIAGIQPGDLIQERKLEHQLLLLNDLPGIKVKSTLAPGHKMGEADIILRLNKDANLVSGSTEVDNWGNRFLGQYQFTPTLILNNPARLGDRLFLQGTFSETGGLLFGQLSYTIPAGYWGTKVGIGYKYLIYELGEDFESLDAYGTAEVVSLFASHPFLRKRSLNLYGQSSIDYKALEDHLDSISIVTEKDTLAWTLRLSGDSRDAWAGGGLNLFSFSYLLGNLDILTPDAKAQDASSTGRKTDGLYHKLNYQIARVQHLLKDTFLYFSTSGQYAPQNLDSSEKIILGGPEGVRAYPTGESSADLGNIVTAEVRWNLPALWRLPGNSVLFGFIDKGWSKINQNRLPSDTSNTRSLLGYGAGFNWGIPNNFSMGATIAWHGDEEPTSDVDRSPLIWFVSEKRF